MTDSKANTRQRSGRARRKAQAAGVDVRAVADSLPVLVLVFDATGACVFANARLRQLTGLGDEAWAGAGWLDAIHPEDRPATAAAWDDAIAATEPFEAEARLRSAEGDHAWHLLRASPDRDGGRILRWVGQATDIDDQKRSGAARAARLAAAVDRSEAERRAAQDLAMAIAEATADCVKTLSLDGRLLSINAAGARAMELDGTDSPVGCDWVEGWRATGYHLAARTAVQEAAWGRTGRFTGLCPTARGTLRWWDVVITPMRDAECRVERLLCVSRDITEAREASERFRLIAETVHEVFYQVDLRGPRVTYVSPAAAAVFGRSPAEITAAPLAFTDTIHPEDRPRVMAALERQRRGEATRLEYRLLHPDGSVRHVRDLAHPVFDADGRPAQIVGAVEDVTAVRRAQAAEPATEIEALYASAPMGLAFVGADLRFRRINARMAEIDGTSVEAHLGRTLREAIPEIADIIEPIYRQVLDTGQPVRGREITGETAARPGVTRHWLGSYDPVRAPDGSVLGVQASVVEISDRKAAEDTLRRSEERHRLALEAIVGFVYDLDIRSGRVERAGRMRDITGFDPDEVASDAAWWLDRIHPEDRGVLDQSGWRTAVAGMGRGETEYRIRHRDGHWVDVLDRRVVIHVPDGPERVVGSTLDVSARKAAEAALRASESRLRAVFNNAGVGVARARLDDGRCLEVNDAACAILGYPREELLALPWSAITHPDDLSGDLSQFQRLSQGEIDRYAVEKRYIRKDGEVVWVRLNLSLARDAWGRPDFEVAIIEDISERKAAEAARRESEEFNRRILEASPDCIKLLSLDGRIEFSSQGGLAAMEVEDFDRQLRGADWVSFWEPEDRPQARAAIAEALGGGTGRFRVPGRALKGTLKWWDVSVNAIRDADGRPERLLTISRDVTRQRGAEERLALLAETAARLLGGRDPAVMLAGIFDLVSGPLRLDAFLNYRLTESGDLRLAAHGGITDEAARAGERLVLGQAVCGCVARDRAPAHVEGVQSSGDARHAFIRAQGLTTYACTPLIVGDRLLGTLGFGRRGGDRFDDEELTFLRTLCHHVATAIDRVRTEERLQSFNAELEARVATRTASLGETARALAEEMKRREAAQAQLLQAQKMEALGQLVGGVAHDFNNVLAAIQGAFLLLDRRVTEPRLRLVIEQGQRAGERATALVRQMLAFARREAIEPKVVDLAELIGGVEGMICHTVGTRTECRFDVAPDTWPVLVDPHQLEVALLNLSVNARDAMPEGGQFRVSVRNLRPDEARPATLGPGDHVVIALTDTGCGMDAATAARVFEPFFTTKSAGRGTGLGLAQVHGFVAGAAGAVAVESEPGTGTTMSLILPRSPIRATEPETSVRLSAELHGKARLLLVDDDDQVRPVTAAYLRDLGYAVAEAPSAAVALAMAQLHRPDLLVSDVVMPGTDGPTLARQLRADWPDLPVLFITGFAAGRDLAGETVVAKPFTGGELAFHVLEMLGRIPKGSARRLSATPHEPEKLLARLTTPELRAAHDRWTAALGGRRLPDLASFDLRGLATDAMAVLRPEGAGEAVVFRMDTLGEALVRRLGHPLDGVTIQPEHEEVLGSIGAAYRRCQVTLGPTYDWARVRLDGGALRFERLVLPFSADGAHITHLVGFVLFEDMA